MCLAKDDEVKPRGLVPSGTEGEDPRLQRANGEGRFSTGGGGKLESQDEGKTQQGQ